MSTQTEEKIIKGFLRDDLSKEEQLQAVRYFRSLFRQYIGCGFVWGCVITLLTLKFVFNTI